MPISTHDRPANLWSVIAASSVGTLIEWYDFYIFGTLATIISPSFFPKDNPTAALLGTFAIFGVGFVVRPFGAIVFGRIGDLVGRKYAFLATLLIMGGATCAIGLLPTYSQVGLLAPALLLILRILQGLALGGEYGGAATYVAEHAPDGKRGFYTSFIQTTATLGLFMSLGVILACRRSVGEEAFKEWGWRLPFLLSIILVAFSYWLRMRLKESPVFAAMKASGKGSAQPLRDSFANRKNLRVVLLALFGATAGQGVVWYTGQFYALFFMQTVLNIDFVATNIIIGAALVLGTPFFIVFGALADRIGRKIMMAGCGLAVLAYWPIYHAMTAAAGFIPGVDGQAGTSPDPNIPILILLVFVQVLLVTMVYGPIAAFLVELFPTRIRYTSMSLPYHIGNGVFGGLVPLISSSIVAKTGSMYAGLFYPMAVAAMTFAIGTLFIKERRNVGILEDDG